MSRSLGDGYVAEVLKTYAYIEDEKLGRVYFPQVAANIQEPCSDLRFKFRKGDHVIFTALKQADIKNHCAYIACAVVKFEELREKTGKISEKFDKFCYVDIPREGRIFVPYSARNAIGKAWLGRGSEVGVTVTIKYFCQPVINDCHFVAFTCEVRESLNPANMKPIVSQGGAHRSPDMVQEQIGCIVVWNGMGADSQVYSSVTGLAVLPASQTQPYMQLGSWIKYIAVKNQSETCRMGWIVSSPVDLGMLFECVPYSMDPSRLQLELPAVVNRVDRKGRAAWMWNDQIGRIYVPPLYFRPSLRPFESANIRVCYTGHFEDVPWSAVNITELAEDESVRDTAALMLYTCDTWRVSHVQLAQGTFYSFLEHESFGSAFAAWTDYTTGETPPKQGALCRVTVYRQERDKKHIYRAVMVTPLDPTTKEPIHHHPAYSPGSKVPNGLSIPLPKAWREPVPVPVPAAPASASARPRATSSSTSGTTGTTGTNGTERSRPPSPPGLVGASTRASSNGLQHNLSMSEVVSGIRRRPTVDEVCEREEVMPRVFSPIPQQFNGVHSNGLDLSPVIGNGIHYGSSLNSPTASSSIHASEHELNGVDLARSQEEMRPIGSPIADLFTSSSFRPNIAPYDPWGTGLLSQELPQLSELPHLAPGFRPNGIGSTSTTSTTSTADAETQTEMMNEHKVLRDIMANTALLVKLFEVLPQHVETVMNMSSFIKRAVD